MLNTIKVYFRLLKRKKIRSIITIGGFALSMAVLIVLVTFIINEKSVNTAFKDKELIYRVIRSDNKSVVPETLLDDVKGQIPGIDKMCLYSIAEWTYKYNDEISLGRFISTNDDFLDIFSLDFIYQIPEPTLDAANNIILTKKFSEKLFGKTNPVGKSIEITPSVYNIIGVVTDLPKNSSFDFDALINVKKDYASRYQSLGEFHKMKFSFIKLIPGVDPNNITTAISDKLKHWKVFRGTSLSIQPLSKVYFYGLPDDNFEHANLNLIYLLSSIAILILLMTIFNYVNLTVSTGYDRLTEIGIKKTTGAGRKDIFRQVLTESVILSFLSILLAVGVAYIISPLFSGILGKKIEITLLFSQPVVLASWLILFLFTGLISGVYPALAFSKLSPLQTIFRQKGIIQRRQRVGMVTIQFLITSVLIISLILIQKQLEYIKHKNLGFDTEMMLRLELDGASKFKWEVLKEELLSYPSIISATASYGSPMKMTGSSHGEYDINGEKIDIRTRSFSVDKDFISNFNLEILHGRDLIPTDINASLINEHLYKELGWSDLAGKELIGYKVVGVVKDFHYENLYNEIGNLQLTQILPKEAANILSVKIKGDIKSNLELINDVYTKVENLRPLSFKFYDDWVQSMYLKEEKQARAIKVFAALAIIISCLGLVGIIEHITSKKVKEIGIRKINGAKVFEIVTMLNKSIVKWVIIAFVVAMPIAYYAMHKWLENFAYKTELSWWIFALAGILALGIALLTVSWQSWKAATRNPVEALRYE